jgi:hypothetical protein
MCSLLSFLIFVNFCFVRIVQPFLTQRDTHKKGRPTAASHIQRNRPIIWSRPSYQPESPLE